MVNLVNFEDVGITLGSRPILGGLSLGVATGQRIGVVGPNGGGKSTLLGLISGQEEADTGRVTRNGDLRVAMLSQANLMQDIPVGQAIHGDVPDHVWASNSQVREVMAGLIPDICLDQLVTSLSGGQARRVALAKVLVSDANLIILDEPTNHLDVDGVDFLAKYLVRMLDGSDKALITVTHDRWFLDAVCEQMWEVVPGTDGPGGRDPQPGHVEQYEGGYAAYVLARAERARLAAQAATKRNNLLRKELAWLRRGAPARTSKPKFRIEAANELIANEPPPRDSVSLVKMASARLGKDVIDLEDVTFAYGTSDTPIIDDVTLRLGPGDRLGIVGANGSGKSTLLGLFSKELEPDKGRVKHGKTVVLAELSQHMDELDQIGHRRVVEAVSDIATSIDVGKGEMSASQLVETLGFTRERAWTEVANLSGGERRRLQLMRLLMGGPNVLIMDEPTNDLDTDTLAAIEDLLDGWPGTLIVVSHDRYLLERITDRQIAVMGGKVRDLPGGVDEYLALRSASAEVIETVEDAPQVSNAAVQRAAQKTMARVERQLTKEREKLASIHAQQAEHALDFEKLASLTADADRISERIGELEDEWLWAAEQAE